MRSEQPVGAVQHLIAPHLEQRGIFGANGCILRTTAAGAGSLEVIFAGGSASGMWRLVTVGASSRVALSWRRRVRCNSAGCFASGMLELCGDVLAGESNERIGGVTEKWRKRHGMKRGEGAWRNAPALVAVRPSSQYGCCAVICLPVPASLLAEAV